MESLKKLAVKFPVLAQLESKTQGKMKQEYSVVVAISLVVIIILSTPIGGILGSLCAVLVPMKETLTLLKQVNPKKEEFRHAVIFWLFFSFLLFLDAYLAFLLAMIPLYTILRFIFLLWIGPCKFGGTAFLYENILAKIPEKFYSYDTPEDAIKSAAKVAKDAFNSTAKNGTSKIQEEGVKKVIRPEGDKKNE
ncbi:putative TB2/DP1-like protein [Hamiltosporidium tvaerminnensis]|uniref:Putative TB2/DP1-like protein n=1 Tax=Hamiltosporidium tvaerminnensis TaxID=1176355 RepID=A0A4Q9LUR1_9MICR|nr:ER membrane protein DP1/Yop1 [Hamiltosporidium tvaerminnensis]TBU00722.1 putative TB2/DP1-like protein [Hamiltosporidium tvaerminnensis]TBU12398.1 putative TB2/DP1-like protein [Hamiltosporidium tvaerminnensis]